MFIKINDQDMFDCLVWCMSWNEYEDNKIVILIIIKECILKYNFD